MIKKTLLKAVNPLLRINPIETLSSNLLTKAVHSSQVERRVSWGEDYPDQTFYVIRRLNRWGLMSIYVMYLRYFDYARRRGWIPVVDMQNVPNLYSNDFDNQNCANEVGQNSWEFFFDQPGGFSLADIAHAKNVVISSFCLLPPDDYRIDWDFLENERLLDKWRNLAASTIHLSPAAQQYIASARDAIAPVMDSSNKVLGVYCRGTDYTHMKPKGHAVQPSPDLVIDKAKEFMQAYGYEKIYLVTEDSSVLIQFQNAFEKQQLCYLDVKRYKPIDDFIWRDEEMLSRSRIQNGMEYLASMTFLSECDSFIGGLTGGTAALFTMRNRPYTHQYIWNLGRY